MRIPRPRLRPPTDGRASGATPQSGSSRPGAGAGRPGRAADGPGRRPFRPHMVESAVDAALAAVHHSAEQRAALSLLVEGPHVPDGASGDGTDGTDLVDRALARRLLAVLGEAWDRGWQPADLVGLVARDRSRRHARLIAEAVVRELALYPSAAVPRRWREQVDELARAHRVASSPGDAGRGDSAWAVRGQRATGIETAVDLLGLVARLPAVPKLGAAPGEPGANASEPGDEVEQRMLQRVRGLLAKAESTTFPDEAEALTAKAQELMARYAIDAAWVAAERGRAPDVHGRRVAIEDPYAAAKAMLLEAIASANHCRSVWSKAFGYATVFGDGADLDGVELLYTSLLVQAAHVMLGSEPGGRRGSAQAAAGRTRSYRQSFLVSFAVRIGDRLAEAVEAATESASVSREALLPVLADRKAAAESALDAVFPTVRATKLSARDHAGWHDGRAAAESAQLDLHDPVARGRRRELN